MSNLNKTDPGRWLLISDLQIPFEHPRALEFCRYLMKCYRIPQSNVINLGDELDQYWGSLYAKSIESEHTANQEIDESIEKLRGWYDLFPSMRLCNSNHGNRWKKKCLASDIPMRFLKRYQEVIDAPVSWRWEDAWIIESKFPFLCEHGDKWGGQYPHIQACLHNGISTALGHHHSKAGTRYIKTAYQSLWGHVAGSLINFDKYAFEYARAAKHKPQIGTSVVLNEGSTVLWLPLET